MALIDDLKDSPSNMPASSKFISFNGMVYMVFGALIMIWPGALQAVFHDPGFAGHERELTRVLGMLGAIIGWFYFFGGRSGSRQVVAASVLHRIILVPLVLVPVAMSGVLPRVFCTIAILDPLLGLSTWYLSGRENRGR